jgi:hypothetical protein
MRTYQLLTEAPIDTIVECIARACKPFLSQISINTPSLARGQTVGLLPVVEGLYISSTLPNRKPRDTSFEVHQIADQWFLEKFGIRYRSDHVVFVTSNEAIASDYGNAGIIIPIGNFSFCWTSQYEDIFYDKLRDNYIQFTIDSMANKKKLTKKQVIIDTLENAHYQDTNLKAAIDAQTEIMIHCQKYFYLDMMSEREYQDIIRQAKELI